MGNKIFVGGLNWDATEDDIREAFGESGTITDARSPVPGTDAGSPARGARASPLDQEETAAAHSQLRIRNPRGRPRKRLGRPSC